MTNTLPRSAPSQQGVNARGVLSFLDAVETTGTDLHSLMILRHGAVVAERWWAPYRPDDIQLVYSLSKTFTAMAIGIAVGEGRLSLDDLVADLLPNHVPAQLPPHLRQLRVRHLLSMASGHRDDTILRLLTPGGDLVRNFLEIPPEEPPGSVFAYNQGNPLTLSALISTLCGERIVDYLRPRLLFPLGIEQVEWLQLSPGLDQGFSGIHVTTEAIAKLGQLLLQDGRWEDRQLVPAAFVAACRHPQVDNAAQSTNPDWQQGYGYLMWMCRHGAQRGDGAYGQLAIVLPAEDAVIACTAEVVDMQAELDLVWEHLLPAFSTATSPGAEADEGAERELLARLANLSTPVIASAAPGPAHAVDFTVNTEGQHFDKQLDGVRVEPLSGGCRLVLTVAGVAHAFDLRPGAWTDGVIPGLCTPFPEVSVTGGWVAPESFHADVVSRRTPHRLRVRATVGSGAANVRWRLPPLPIPTVGP